MVEGEQSNVGMLERWTLRRIPRHPGSNSEFGMLPSCGDIEFPAHPPEEPQRHRATHASGSQNSYSTKGKRILVVLWCGRPGRTCRRDAYTTSDPTAFWGSHSRRGAVAEGLVARKVLGVRY